jgi:hypothetical protein
MNRHDFTHAQNARGVSTSQSSPDRVGWWFLAAAAFVLVVMPMVML